ncbi:recQ-mediated genome instability protein 2 [Tiliqua scincoides]|uniref:recQ-mediated genome instability protein 2 n=1 Tax=Tiliqua scincoides TaxID=71010 RepID=UPI00346302A8
MAEGEFKPGSSKSTSPPVKVLASQLRSCRGAAGGVWLLERAEYGRPALAVRLVWMQGTVLAVGPGGATLRLRDESGPFVAEGADGVPQGRPCLSAGKYVMVLGVVRSCGPEPVLRAVKVTDLSGSPLHRSMWALEVEDLHRNALL